MKSLMSCIALAVACVSAAPVDAQMTAGGSTFARRLMESWTQAHGGIVGGATYEAIGSSAGVARLTAGTLDLAVSDVPLTTAGLKQSGAKQIPLAASGVAVLVNLPELNAQPLKLSGLVVAAIFTGQVTRWNHSMITAINPSVKLPDRAIVPVWREDGSGQSHAFSTYLSRGDSRWRLAHGVTSNLSGLAGRPVKGGAAMLEAIRSTPGAIGYDAFTATPPAGVSAAAMQNASQKYVAPSAATIGAALAQARWSFEYGDNAADLDASPGADSYPISAVAYAIFSAKPAAGKRSAAPLLERFNVLGDVQVAPAGFLPLPAQVKAAALQALK
jgi:phosphate transport system substrate-binding protein